ncbi:TonB family protein [Oleiharenicola lentus]|uniref:TonB family protein n=1 Tax=Oleiharenicola lentus TaxID=2508720 RepID=A0A4V1M6S1_9BACT|nr:TonB family protein [Oleiharenicola lentus]RXK56379.1 TonB family protein [Oleiharenicola lentus]
MKPVSDAVELGSPDNLARGHRLLAVAGGVGGSGLILLGFAWLNQRDVDPVPDPAIPWAVEMAMPPPPPPPVPPIPEPPAGGATVPREIAPVRAPAPEAPAFVSLQDIRLAAPRPESRVDLHFAREAFMPEVQPGGLQWERTFTAGEVERVPVALDPRIPQVDYSLLPRDRRSAVVLLFVVTAKGKVSKLQLVQGVHRRIDPVVIDAVRRWNFQPAVKQGRAVDCWVQQPIVLQRPGVANPYAL